MMMDSFRYGPPGRQVCAVRVTPPSIELVASFAGWVGLEGMCHCMGLQASSTQGCVIGSCHCVGSLLGSTTRYDWVGLLNGYTQGCIMVVLPSGFTKGYFRAIEGFTRTHT